MSISYAGGSAEQAYGGVQINMVPREGGNSFKGSFYGTGTNSSFQGHNITPELMAQGLTASNRINEPIIGWSDSISACHSQNESR